MDPKSRNRLDQPLSNQLSRNYASTSQTAGLSSTPMDPIPAAATAAAIAEDARARNARAQARHRAKRKAYISHLETSLTTLQEALRRNNGDSRLRQLEHENARLLQEVEVLRSQIDAAGISDDGSEASSLYGDIPRYSSAHGSPYVQSGQPHWQGRSTSPHGYWQNNLGRSSHIRDSSHAEGGTDSAHVNETHADVDPREAGIMGWSPSQDKKPLPPTA